LAARANPAAAEAAKALRAESMADGTRHQEHYYHCAQCGCEADYRTTYSSYVADKHGMGGCYNGIKCHDHVARNKAEAKEGAAEEEAAMTLVE